MQPHYEKTIDHVTLDVNGGDSRIKSRWGDDANKEAKRDANGMTIFFILDTGFMKQIWKIDQLVIEFSNYMSDLSKKTTTFETQQSEQK